jgi:hypothetical protein
MRLSAPVERVVGQCRYYWGTIVEGQPVPVEAIPAPVRVGIEAQDSAYFLFHYDAHEQCIADDWLETADQAKAFAKRQFDIDDDDWTTLA